ncbi:MAG: TlpA family protein disulfide reductase [Oscillospiraceae bacterium]|nr:TlpA family protein disulfide reductase [Oscillospiraceae bacterium]
MKRLKNLLSFVLVLVLVGSMLPAAFAIDANTFDAAAALEKQSIWDYITEFGSLMVNISTYYSYGSDDCYDMDEQYEYYFNPNNPPTSYRVTINEIEGGEVYYEYTFFEDYPTGKLYTYYYNGEAGEDGCSVQDTEEYAVTDLWYNNISGYDLSDARLKYQEEDNGFIVCEYCFDGYDVTFYFDASDGWLNCTRESSFLNTGTPCDIVKQFSPCNTDLPDLTFRDSIAAEAGVSIPSAQSKSLSSESRLTFHTTDLYGRSVDESILQGAKLVILNFWEPWCGPCCKELPDMEKLYQKYKNAGVVFLGVYGRHEVTTDEDAEDIIEGLGVTYPIIRDCSELSIYENDGWPENYFFDGEGKLLSLEPDGGYKTYEAWENLILQYLYR